LAHPVYMSLSAESTINVTLQFDYMTQQCIDAGQRQQLIMSN